MTLQQLQALVAIADTGSIRAAARRIGLSQAAVSKTVRELERDQRLLLLTRHAGGVGFTDAGLKLLNHARLVVTQLGRASEELAELRGEHAGHLSIAVTPWVMYAFIPATLERFREHMPYAELEIVEGLAMSTLPRLRDGTIDFAVIPYTAAMSDQEFESRPLFGYESCVIARRDHPASGARSIRELVEQNWVVNFTVATYPEVMNILFWQHGVDIAPHRLHRAQSSAFLQALVRYAGMLGYLPNPLLHTDLSGEWMQILPLKERFTSPEVGIVTRRNAISHPVAQCFIDCMIDAIRQRARSSKADDARLFDMLELLI